jgi:hypothetical protein
VRVESSEAETRELKLIGYEDGSKPYVSQSNVRCFCVGVKQTVWSSCGRALAYCSFLMAALLSFHVANLRATTIKYPSSQGNSVVVSGVLMMVAVKDIIRFVDSHSELEHIEFRSCYGGELEAARLLASEIRKRKLKTRAAQYVASGCALAYLAGIERVQVRGMPLVLHFHSPSKDGKRVSPEQTEELLDELNHYTNGKFPGIWREPIATRIEDAGVFIISPAEITLPRMAMICDKRIESAQDLKRVCTNHVAVSLEDYGLVRIDSANK